jgi:hypothetical protein
MRVFLDANILFSASQPQSRMRALLEVIVSRAVCLSNAYAIEEARRNLELKCPAALPQFVKLLEKCEVVSGLTVDLEYKAMGSRLIY